jgi:multisubunit Na+/H+ antiporter MnhB subunit
MGFIMFGLNIAPGIGFTVGAALSVAVLLAVSRYRHGKPIISTGGKRVSFNPLIAVAVVITVLAVSISLRAAWVLDVSDVNNILHSVQ